MPRYRGKSLYELMKSDRMGVSCPVIRVVPRKLFAPEADYRLQGLFLFRKEEETVKNVWIADATLVQGMANFSFKESVEIARQLEKLRVSVIEIPKFVNTAKDVLLVKTIASFVKDSVISVDAGSTEDSIAVAAGSLQSAQQGRLRIVLTITRLPLVVSFSPVRIPTSPGICWSRYS